MIDNMGLLISKRWDCKLIVREGRSSQYFDRRSSILYVIDRDGIYIYIYIDEYCTLYLLNFKLTKPAASTRSGSIVKSVKRNKAVIASLHYNFFPSVSSYQLEMYLYKSIIKVVRT